MGGITGITLKQLRAVDAVAQTGSITQAASLLGLTPPAVHTQLRALEAQLGCTIVEKGDKSGMVLTAEGQLIHRAQGSIEVCLKSCVNQIDAMRKGLAGSVVLGVVSTGKYFAPALVAGLKKSFNNIDVKLYIGNRRAMIEALNERSVDMVIMGRPPREPMVTAKAIGAHPHVMIAAPDNRLVRPGLIEPEEILDEVIISREPGSGTRILMMRYLDRIGEGKRYETIEMDSNETIKQAVIAGLGIALISQHTVTEELKAGRLVAIQTSELPIQRQWFVLLRDDQVLTSATRTVWDFINENSEQFFPRLGS
ncbi:MAG: LysR family transcriptional regulator [Paracoccaceae bacterium]